METDSAPWRNRDLLERKYHSEGKSAREIAAELGCSDTNILNWMRKHGIPRRKPLRERNLHFETGYHGYEIVSNNFKGVQRSVYVHKLVAIAEYGFDAVDGKLVHHKNGIKWDNRPSNLEPMTRSEHGSVHARNSDAPWRDKDRFRKLYSNHTQTEMAEMWNCGQPLISKWAKRHGLRD